MVAEPINSPQATEDKECDLVMKGGITSGIVYPPLVIKLHDDGYRFRKVGGTSAGAIAAAVTAAAELGGDTGFRKLDEVRKWLGTGRNLLDLFQASSSTAAVLRTFLIYPKLKWLRLFPLKLIAALFMGDLLFFMIGAALGVGLSFLFAWLVGGSLKGYGIILPVILGLVGALIASAAHLYLILTKAVPKNFFGICTGRGRKKSVVDMTALTDWLTMHLNDLAGMEANEESAPLTFGDLWAKKEAQDERRIDLRMMTSNLSQNRPFVMPFDDVYLFRQDEFERLFPRNVVRHMVEHQRRIRNFESPPGYFLFPEAKDLPVVVATRMSLSFPVLIGMIPLYTIGHNAFETRVRFDLEPDPEHPAQALRIVLKVQRAENEWVEPSKPLTIRKPDEGLQRNWFSDGGICSNFPIQFFDSWLPTRPTFGVTLTSQLSGRPPSERSSAAADVEGQQVADPQRFSYTVQQPTSTARAAASAGVSYGEGVSYNKDVYLPQPGSEAAPEFTPIPGLPDFLSSIFSTAQNYRDNMQAVLPSYYERIVQIRLLPDEGGLNLEMPSELIEKVVKKGDAAGEAFITEFDFDKHQWVRFRVLMGQMEKALVNMDRVMKTNAAGKKPFNYPELLKAQGDPAEGYPYVRDLQWCANASARLAAMGQMISAWVPPSLAGEPPLPEPVLRVTPEV